MPSSTGILVLDNNCFRRLVDTDAQRRLISNSRAADLPVRASEVNLLEASLATAPIRERIMAAIRTVSAEGDLLPWPLDILRMIGRAVLDGRQGFHLPPSGKEWYLRNPRALQEVQAKAMSFRDTLEARFNKMHDDARPRIQRKIRDLGRRYGADGAAEFLDGWADGEIARGFAASTWRALSLPGEPPIERLLLNDAWRIMLDAEGLSIFRRAIAHEQPRRVHRLDLLQLVYLGGVDRRVIATADEPFLDAAVTILRGRYPNARAVHIHSLLT